MPGIGVEHVLWPLLHRLYCYICCFQEVCRNWVFLRLLKSGRSEARRQMHRSHRMHPLALRNGAANPQGSLCRHRSSFFPRAVSQPDADACSSYLSHCDFWPLSHHGFREAPSAAGGMTARKHLQNPPLRKPTVSYGPGVHQALARAVPFSRAPCTPKGPPLRLLNPSRCLELSFLLGSCLVLGYLQQQVTFSLVVTLKESNSD